MKKITLSVLAIVAFGATVQAQQLSSDDPSFQQNTSSKIPQTGVLTPTVAEAITVSTTTLPCGGGTDTLVATGMTCNYLWSTDSMGMNVISTSDSAIVGPITVDTTFYLATTEGSWDSLAPLPAHSSIFSGNVRGYYFTAPVDFVITGLFVPTEASSGTQNIEVLLFDGQTPPPLWSGTTNAFTSLGYWNNYSATDTIKVCFPISAGDVVGVYGNRADANSYAPAPYTSEIAGIPTTFTRSGMQSVLSTNQMFDVFSETGSSISRVEFFYDLSLDTVVTPITLTVPTPEYTSSSPSICQGDSIFAGGAYQMTAGVYTDSLQTVFGCDSIVTTALTVNPSSFTTIVASICQGDSVYAGGALQTTAGVYTELDVNQFGCDSIIETTVYVNALPTVSLLGDTLCLQDGAVSMNGTPSGGTYSGTGVSGSQFNASTAGVGVHPVTYSYTDSSGCANAAVETFLVEDCASIGENTLDGVKVYPNPMDDYIEVVLPSGMQSGSAVLYDAKGRIVHVWTLGSGTAVLNVADVSAGIYTIEIKDNQGLNAQFRVVKK